MQNIISIVIGLSMALFTMRAPALVPIEAGLDRGKALCRQLPRAGECECEAPWQHACAQYLNGLAYYSGLYIGDVNGDQVPEVVVDINTLGSTVVLCWTGNSLQELDLETVSAWGSVTWIPATGQFLHSPFYGHTTGTWGYEEYILYDWTGTEYVQTFSMLRESGYYWDEENYEYGESFIDGEKVDNAVFEGKLAEMEALKEKNSGSLSFWSLEEEDFEEKVREFLPCFEMPRWEER